MKILFFLAVWRRPEITEVCFMGLDRLKRAGLFSVDFLAVISEESMIPLCKKYGIDYCFTENLPLGRKKNFGLTQAFKKDWDYMIELGSDDILKTEIFELYKPHFNTHPVLSLSTFCFLNSEDGECRIVKTSTSYGMGRAMERKALENVTLGVDVEAIETLISPGRSVNKGEIGFFPTKDAQQMAESGLCKIVGEERHRLWVDHFNKRLDNSSNFFLAVNGVTGKRIQHDEPMAIDIKGPENIWMWNPESGEPYDLDKAMKGLSDNEVTAIKSLCESKVLHSN